MNLAEPTGRPSRSVKSLTRARPAQEGWLAALPARQPGIELHIAGIVGALGREDLVVARDQPDRDLPLALGGLQRMHEGVDTVIAGEGREAEVGDDEPLGGAL